MSACAWHPTRNAGFDPPPPPPASSITSAGTADSLVRPSPPTPDPRTTYRDCTLVFAPLPPPATTQHRMIASYTPPLPPPSRQKWEALPVTTD